MAAGQALACLVFVAGAGDQIRMPFPLAPILAIAACAALTGLSLRALDLVTGTQAPLGTVLQLAVFCLAAGTTAWRFDIAGVASGLARNWRRA